MLGSGVAHAEGSWSNGMDGWLTGKESRHWTDNNKDTVATTVKLSGCTVSGASSFKSATLQLKKERTALPDTVVARHDNACNTSNYGRQGKGGYYFNLSRINGVDSGIKIWATASVKY
ncbi:hypothetical protein GCM10020227_14320 [Streptomyces flavovirens]